MCSDANRRRKVWKNRATHEAQRPAARQLSGLKETRKESAQVRRYEPRTATGDVPPAHPSAHVGQGGAGAPLRRFRSSM